MKQLRKLTTAFMAFLMMGFASVAFAQQAPDDLIRQVSSEVVSAAKSNSAIKRGNKQQIYKLVQTKIFPHVDFGRMTALATGRAWRDATADQKNRLTKEFRQLLVHTYAGAISKINDQRIEVKKLNLAAGATEAIVNTRIIQSKGSPIPVNYRLYKSGNQWKIYDVSVLNAWIVTSYKTSFANEIKKGGIDGLIKMLANKNASLAKKPLK